MDLKTFDVIGAIIVPLPSLSRKLVVSIPYCAMWNHSWWLCPIAEWKQAAAQRTPVHFGESNWHLTGAWFCCEARITIRQFSWIAAQSAFCKQKSIRQTILSFGHSAALLRDHKLLFAVSHFALAAGISTTLLKWVTVSFILCICATALTYWLSGLEPCNLTRTRRLDDLHRHHGRIWN